MGVLSSSPGFVPGSNGPAVQGDWHREWKTAVWEETQNYKSECVEITAEGPVSTHLIVLHLTEDLNLFLTFDWIIMCFKTCEYFPSDIVPLLPLPPFFHLLFLPPFYCDFNIFLQHANLSSVQSGTLSGSLEPRWTRFNLQPVLFFFLAL